MRYIIWLSLFLSMGCGLWTTPSPPKEFRKGIGNIYWTQDKQQLIFVFGNHKKDGGSGGNSYLYSVDRDGKNLKEINPELSSEIPYFHLWDWSPTQQTFLLSSMQKIYTLTSEGQIKAFSDELVQKILAVKVGLFSNEKDSLLGLFSILNIVTLEERKLTYDFGESQSNEMLAEYGISNIIINPTNTYIYMNNQSKYILIDGSYQNLSTISHAVGDFNLETGVINDIKVFKEQIIKGFKEQTNTSYFRFVGWKDNNTILYVFQEIPQSTTQVTFQPHTTDLFEYNTLTQQTIKIGILQNNERFSHHYQISPDFKQLSFSDNEGLKVADLDGKNEELIVPLDALPDGDPLPTKDEL